MGRRPEIFGTSLPPPQPPSPTHWGEGRARDSHSFAGSVLGRRPGRLAGFARRLLGSRTAAFGVALTALLALVAVFAPLVAPYRPDEIHPIDSLMAPSARYPLGTDDLGRDILSRIVFGARVSLMVGAIAIGIAAALGLPLGL